MTRKNTSPALPDTLEAFTLDLIEDLKAFRAGTITARDARIRAMLAREVLRAVHLQLDGLRLLAARAKPVPAIGGKAK